MKYVTMPKIKEEQKDSFISLLNQERNDKFDVLLDWLYSGSTRSVMRKGNAADALLRFTDTSKTAREENTKVHIHNDVQCAINGYMAAVILPESKGEWDLVDAYIDRPHDKNNPRFELSKLFEGRYNATQHKLSAEIATDLIDACKARQEAYKKELAKLSKAEKKSAPKFAIIYINIETMESISENEAIELNESGESVFGFNVKFLEDNLKFILCAGTNEIEMYYSGNTSQWILRANNLYSLILPVRIKRKEMTA